MNADRNSAHQLIKQCKPLDMDSVYAYLDEKMRLHIARVNVQLAERLRQASRDRKTKAADPIKPFTIERKQPAKWFL